MLEAYNINDSVNHYAVFGNPVEHSKSPLIHQLFAEQFGLSIKYQAIPVEPGMFFEAVTEFYKLGGKGINVTVPFKQDAYEACEILTQRAKICQSVNTSWLDKEGRINGDTTDGQGLINDLVTNNNIVLQGKSILIMGAGGTVRSILQPLLQLKPDSLTIVNRTVSRAQSLAIQFSNEGLVSACSYSDLQVKRFDLIVNATSLSLQGELPPLPAGVLNHAAACYDLMYGDEDTVFMQWARSNGAGQVLDGLGMLVEQAAIGFQIWHGKKPDTASVIAKLRTG
ncbi:MAG: shikimate dehydrogenase [Gammaproteobacteria bacterium]